MPGSWVATLSGFPWVSHAASKQLLSYAGCVRLASVLTEWARLEPRQGYIDEDAVKRQGHLAVPVLSLSITDACSKESSKISRYTPL